jgi:uroporphyrinogen decarboxylase
MKELTSVERVQRVLRREEPDRIPHFEWSIDRKVREAICPGCSMEEFTVRMGLDAILTAPNYASEQVGPRRFRNEWGTIIEYSEEEYGFPVEGPIKTMADLDRYTPPKPGAPGRFASLEELVSRHKGKLAIGVHLNDVLSIPRNLMGFENLMAAFVEQPELVRALVDLSVQSNLALAKEAAIRGADFLWTGDDYASTERPFVSPRMFREVLYPGLKRVVSGFKETGLPMIKHTDGNITPLLEMIVDSGIDCLDPIDPLAGLDIGEIKRQYGGRVALKGNVNCAQTLTFATEQQVVDETISVIQQASQGGGLIVSSSNSIHSGVKPGNYLAMLKTIHQHGKYPIP